MLLAFSSRLASNCISNYSVLGTWMALVPPTTRHCTMYLLLLQSRGLTAPTLSSFFSLSSPVFQHPRVQLTFGVSET